MSSNSTKLMSTASCPPGDMATAQRADVNYGQHLFRVHSRADRMFAWLFGGQWVMGMLAALLISPETWAGGESSIHVHLLAAIGLGGVLSIMPIILALKYPGRLITRHTIAVAQMLTSALLIHLTGGRIETHFHVFGSLAFLAVYRDCRVLVTGTVVIAIDHLVRGIFWPESVYGVLTATPWRTLEHAGWVIFEVTVLLYSIRHSVQEIRQLAIHTAELEDTNVAIEARAMERAKELEHAQLQLLHSEKLAAVGGLAAGIAHEINTPTQFVGDNVRACRDMFSDLERLVVGYQQRLATLEEQGAAIPDKQELVELIAEVDPDYIFEDAPEAFKQTLEGVDRIRSIVAAMKNFSHGGSSDERSLFNINDALQNTLTVARNEVKYIANLELGLGEIPEFNGYQSELNQVFLNLIVNAAHAIADAGDESGTIFVHTSLVDEEIEITITDTGGGIPESVRGRIFEPFFTTKEVGRGSGQGLAIAHQIVVERHGGTISFETELGQGTTFVIRLPLDPSKSNHEELEPALAT